MSDTPETDEQINGKPCTSFFVCAGDTLRDALVPSEFARKLERERDDLLKKLDSTEWECVERGKDIETLKSALKGAREERDEAREEAARWEAVALREANINGARICGKEAAK